ncbi:sigma factor-like helix-turn-helix DNA-binding protein [Nonomuraea phyllanthi]|uniref:sigma factor-like helix-turn-helix DNA-binding protein n=1 Tax=Nonomuraea phyllanthi TaxID=2219224 RepID=UPI0029392F98|nr:sigma factor-like helix-turn-helix DNA-binding protein [Nonomuraea phyllanthi]
MIDDRRRHEPGGAPVPDEVGGPLHQVVVSEALKALSPAHREILNETILRNRSVDDAAKALGIPVGTVKSRVYYAVRALRIALQERGVRA